jgi:hypothetical protein
MQEGKVMQIFALLGALMMLIPASNRGGATEPGELIMVCRGDINAIGEVGWNKKNETIAAHVKNEKISLSGNDFLGGRDIRICPSGPWGPSDDELYFDTRGCGPSGKYDPRTYGTYNKIIRTLDVTHTAEGFVISGRFKCENP